MCFSKKKEIIIVFIAYVFYFLLYYVFHSNILSNSPFQQSTPQSSQSKFIFFTINHLETHQQIYAHPSIEPPFNTQPTTHHSVLNHQPTSPHPTLNPPFNTQPSTHLSTLSHQPTIQYLFTDLFQNPHLLKISLTK